MVLRARRPTPCAGAPVVRTIAALAIVLAALAMQAAGAAGRWERRLEALDPVRPIDYLELGEEVADVASSDAERALARELFGLAGALDPARLGRSAMLALASIAEGESERARCLAIAAIVGGGGAAVDAFRADPAQIEALSRAFSYHRRGDGRRALAALRQSDADSLLERIGLGLPGGAAGFRAECEQMRASGRPIMDPDGSRRQVLVELALRLGDARRTSLDLALLGDAALVEIDPDDPASTWGVDPSKPWWRGGWRGND